MVAIARAGAQSPPNLDAQMRTCRAQLADWVTCPSAKTPEGKAKIEQISTKLDEIKHEIKKSDGNSPSAMIAGRSDAAPHAADAGDYLGASNQVGTIVNTYA
jgi:hypothetical protein